MLSTRSARRRHWGVRALVVGATIAGTTALSAAVATSASAVVKNPNTLCAPHGGVAEIGKGYIKCQDGEEFEVGYPI